MVVFGFKSALPALRLKESFEKRRPLGGFRVGFRPASTPGGSSRTPTHSRVHTRTHAGTQERRRGVRSLITQHKAFTLDPLFNFLIWISGR